MVMLRLSESAPRSILKCTLNRDEVLFSMGSPVERVYQVIRGSVRIVAYPHDGKPLVLFRAIPGDVFSEDHLLDDHYRYSAIAMEETVIASICRDALIRELENDPQRFQQYFSCLCRRFHQLRSNFERIAIPEAKRRVLNLLRSLATSDDRWRPIALRGTIKSYADDLNLTHEAIYRALRKLEAEGTISRLTDGSIRVNNQT